LVVVRQARSKESLGLTCRVPREAQTPSHLAENSPCHHWFLDGLHLVPPIP
jgi:hypothetical protein